MKTLWDLLSKVHMDRYLYTHHILSTTKNEEVLYLANSSYGTIVLDPHRLYADPDPANIYQCFSKVHTISELTK
jgi:hypothetical protein